MRLLLIPAYALLVHVAVMNEAPRLEALALLLAVAGMLGSALRQGRSWAFAALALAAGAAFLLARTELALYALYLPPVVIPAALCLVFAGSLRRASEPLVARIARAARGDLPPELQRYTRQVTLLWSLVLAAMALWGVALALWGTPHTWSLVTNFVNYAVLAAVFAGEYAWRRLRYSHHGHPPLRDYLQGLGRQRPL